MSWTTRALCIALSASALFFANPCRIPADEPAQPAASARRGASAIERALASRTEMEFIETPLSNVIDYLEDRHAIDIHLDRPAIEDAGITPDTPISLNLRGISLRSALELMLAELEMTWTVRHDTLVLTTAEAEESQRTHRVYDISTVTDPGGDSPFDAEAVADLVQVMVAASLPGDADAGGISHAGDALIVTHNGSVHETIAQLLADLRSLKTTGQAPGRQPTTEEAKVAQALRESTEMEFIDTPLLDILDYLADRHRISIVVDRKGLEDAGITSDTPISFRANGIALSKALALMLDDLELDWRIWKETLQITTRETTDNSADVRVYPVADLLAKGQTADGLIDAITSLPTPTEQSSWDDGSLGAIQSVPGGLVICQTDRAHREVDSLLAELRKLPPLADGADADPFRFQIYVVRGVAPSELVQPIQLMVAPGAWGGAADPGSIVAVAGLAASVAAADEPEATDDAPKPKFEELLNGQSELSKLIGGQANATHSGWLLVRQRASIQRRIETLLDRMDVLVEVK